MSTATQTKPHSSTLSSKLVAAPAVGHVLELGHFA